MSNKPINENSAFLNNTLLDLPVLRETFVAPETAARADLYAIRKATERTLELSERDRDEKALQVYNPEIILPQRFTDTNEKVLETMQDMSYSISDIVASNQSGFTGLQDGMKSVREGITDMTDVVHSDLGVLNLAVRTIYGTNLPKNKSFSELGKELSRDGKSTALAMMLVGGLDEEKSRNMFGERFLGYIKQGLTKDQAIIINNNCLRELELITKQKENLFKNKSKLDPEEYKRLNDSFFTRRRQISERLITDEDINLLGISEKVVGKSILELAEKGIVNPKILEVMVRNGVTNGDTSDKLAKIIRKDENGVISPLIELSGVTGIFQQAKAQTVLQNIVVRQGSHQIQQLGEVNRNLGDINYGIQESNRSLGSIDLGIQEINKTIGSFGNGLFAISSQLGDIGDYLEVGNQLHEITNMTLGELLVSSERVGQEIALTREVIGNLLVNVGEVIVSGISALRGDIKQNTQEIRNLNTLQAYSLTELRKQTEILLDVNNTLKTPGNTRANELVLDGVKALESNYIDDAKECFIEAFKLSRMHLLANLGIGFTENCLGNHNEALKYFFRAEDFATKEGNDLIASLSMFEQAKIFVKSMNLNKALFLLEKAESMNPDNMEIKLLKANVLLMKKEIGLLSIEIEELFNKMFFDKIAVNGDVKGYDKVLGLMKKKVINHIKGLINDKNYSDLYKVFKTLENCSFNDALITAVEYIIKKDIEGVIESGIDMKKIIESKPKKFLKIYNEIITNNSFILSQNGGKNAYTLALWGYNILPFDVIEKIILIGINNDANYLYYKRKVDEDKTKLRHKFLNNIYSVGFYAKEMLSKFLGLHPELKI